MISGVRLLKRLMDCSPTAIYWGYLEERAQKLRVSFFTAEEPNRLEKELSGKDLVRTWS